MPHEVTPKGAEEVMRPEEDKVTPKEDKVTPKDNVTLEKKSSFTPTMASHISSLFAFLLAVVLALIL